jgi:hypothetical protein
MRLPLFLLIFIASLAALPVGAQQALNRAPLQVKLLRPQNASAVSDTAVAPKAVPFISLSAETSGRKRSPFLFPAIGAGVGVAWAIAASLDADDGSQFVYFAPASGALLGAIAGFAVELLVRAIETSRSG